MAPELLRRDRQEFCQSDNIAALRASCQRPCPLRLLRRHLSQRGRGFQNDEQGSSLLHADHIVVDRLTAADVADLNVVGAFCLDDLGHLLGILVGEASYLSNRALVR